MTPLGQLRFGRMPSHWGLGMLVNAGDGIDCDYQTNADRIMFVIGHQVARPLLRRRVGLRLDGPDERVALRRLRRPAVQHVQPLATSTSGSAFVAHRTNPELQQLKLARGDLVVNGGLYARLPHAATST